MSNHATNSDGRRSSRRRAFGRLLAAAIMLAVLAPGVAMSTVPAIHSTRDLKSWKNSSTGTYSSYAACWQGQLTSPTGTHVQSDCGSPPSSGTPPTYWTAYYTYSFVWKGDPLKVEVTVPFSYWASKPASERILVDYIRIELTGMRRTLYNRYVKLTDGNGNAPIENRTYLWLDPDYTRKDYGPWARVNSTSDAVVYGHFLLAEGSADSVPNISWALPIQARRTDRSNQADPKGRCYTPNQGIEYPCSSYISIKPV